MEQTTEEVGNGLLTVQDAAREAGVTEAAIRNAIYRGKLTTVQKYGRKLIPRTSFEQYRAVAKPGRPKKAESA